MKLEDCSSREFVFGCSSLGRHVDTVDTLDSRLSRSSALSVEGEEACVVVVLLCLEEPGGSTKLSSESRVADPSLPAFDFDARS